MTNECEKGYSNRVGDLAAYKLQKKVVIYNLKLHF